MSQAIRGQLSDQYLVHFGTIVQCFAHHEVLVQEIMAAVSGADVTSIRLLTSGLNFGQKLDALFNLLRHRAVSVDQLDHIRNYLQMPRTYTPLRNDIAHSTWVEALPQTAIRPLWLSHGPLTALKPLHDVGQGDKEFIEDYDDKVTYTLDDLKEIGDNLATNHAEFREYITRVGLISARSA